MQYEVILLGKWCQFTEYNPLRAGEPEPWFRVEYTFDQDFLAVIKSVPVYLRKPSEPPEAFYWEVHPDYKESLMKRAQQIFARVYVIGPNGYRELPALSAKEKQAI